MRKLLLAALFMVFTTSFAQSATCPPGTDPSPTPPGGVAGTTYCKTAGTCPNGAPQTGPGQSCQMGPICPVGLVPGSGNTCTAPVCGPGQVFVNNQCIVQVTSCPSGSTLINNLCVITPQCPSVVAAGYPSSGNKAAIINGQCVVSSPTCPQNTQLTNGVCVANTPPCKQGYAVQVINNVPQCVGTSVNCGNPKAILYNNICFVPQ